MTPLATANATYALVARIKAIAATRNTLMVTTLLIMPCLSLERKVTQSLTVKQDLASAFLAVSFFLIVPPASFCGNRLSDYPSATICVFAAFLDPLAELCS